MLLTGLTVIQLRKYFDKKNLPKKSKKDPLTLTNDNYTTQELRVESLYRYLVGAGVFILASISSMYLLFSEAKSLGSKQAQRDRSQFTQFFETGNPKRIIDKHITQITFKKDGMTLDGFLLHCSPMHCAIYTDTKKVMVISMNEVMTMSTKPLRAMTPDGAPGPKKTQTN